MSFYSNYDIDSLKAAQWLLVPTVGQATIGKIQKVLEQHQATWSDSWQLFSLLRQANVISAEQLLQAKEFRQRSDLSKLSKFQKQLAAEGIGILASTQQIFPYLLQQIKGSPPLLFVKGSSEIIQELARPDCVSVAVVGSRRMTPYGKQVTTSLCRDLVGLGVITVSGGMYGVDATAHQSTIEFGGKTVVVLGAGILAKQPSWQEKLLENVLANNGLVISQFHPWQSAQVNQFPMRNRVVAGLSRAVVVVEAAASSGSLITANCALEFNREVCAVPGSIFSHYSEGTRHLLNQGAQLAASGGDVVATFSNSVSISASTSAANVSTNLPTNPRENSPNITSKLLQVLKDCTELSTEQLASEVSLSLSQTTQLVSELELEGVISKRGNAWFLCS